MICLGKATRKSSRTIRIMVEAQGLEPWSPVCRTGALASVLRPHYCYRFNCQRPNGTSDKEKAPNLVVWGLRLHHTLRVWLHPRRSCPHMRLRLGDIAERRIPAEGQEAIHGVILGVAPMESQPEIFIWGHFA